MASGPSPGRHWPPPPSKSHTPLGGFLNCEHGGRRTCVLLHLHLHHHLNSIFTFPSAPCYFTFTVTSPSQLASPSESFTGAWWACRPPGPQFPSTSHLFSSHCLHLLISSMSLHLHSYLHLQSLSPVPGGQAGNQGHGFLQLHFSHPLLRLAVHAAVVIPL